MSNDTPSKMSYKNNFIKNNFKNISGVKLHSKMFS